MLADSIPVVEESEAEKPLPRQRIHHFFMWMIAVAAVFSGYKLIRLPQDAVVIGSEVVGVFYLVPFALACSTLLFGLYWQYRGIRFFREPGQWLLLVVTFQAVQYAVSMVAITFLRTSMHSVLSRFLFLALPGWLIGLATWAVYFWLWKQKTLARHWRRFFFAALLISVLSALVTLTWHYFSFISAFWGHDGSLHAHMAMQVIWPIILLIFLTLALVNDGTSRQRRLWSHWCGACAWGAQRIVEVLTFGTAMSYLWNQ